MGDIPDQGQQQLFIQNIQPKIVCIDCQANDRCKMKSITNKLTPLTLYVIRYIAQTNQFSGVKYPYQGGWQNQPDWILLAWNMGFKQKNKMQQNKLSKAK